MKQYLSALAMCQSMFCAIPSPQLWDERAKDKMLLFLPLIGLEIGAIWAGLAWVCRMLCLPATIAALVLCACPYVLTGYIHLDGYMDVTDAVKSWRDIRRRREILKDSHVGSFAVIGFGLLLLAQFACFAAAPADANVWVLLLIPVVSRCCSALAITGLKPMSTSQYADRGTHRGQLVVLLGMLCVCLVAGFLLWGKSALPLAGCMVGYALALRRGYRSLDGMNGDISGYALTLGELCAVAIYALQ